MIARVVLMLAASAWALSTQPPQRSTRITVHVGVEDAGGAPVPNVPASAFVVALDGVRQPIASVVPATTPMSIVVLIDRSRSMTPPWSTLDEAVKAFVTGLAPADRVRAANFVDAITFAPAFSADKQRFRASPRRSVVLRPRKTRGGSPLWDAIHDAVEALATEPPPRAVIVISDARSSGNWYSLGETADFAIQHGVAVTALTPQSHRDIEQYGQTVLLVKPDANLIRLASYTGGLALSDPMRVPTQERDAWMRAAAQRFRAGYNLAFDTPLQDGQLHRLEISVNSPRVQVRAPLAIRAPSSESR